MGMSHIRLIFDEASLETVTGSDVGDLIEYLNDWHDPDAGHYFKGVEYRRSSERVSPRLQVEELEIKDVPKETRQLVRVVDQAPVDFGTKDEIENEVIIRTP